MSDATISMKRFGAASAQQVPTATVSVPIPSLTGLLPANFSIQDILSDPSPEYAKIRSALIGVVGYKLGGVMGAISLAVAWAHYRENII